MKPRIFDFHAHAFPDRNRLFSRFFSRSDAIEGLRKRARSWLKPIVSTLHSSQPYLRIIPESLRKPIDELAALAPIPGLLFESTPKDLRSAMSLAGVDRALVIAHPPFLTNDELMEICAEFSEFVPTVNIPVGTSRPGETLRNLIRKGAKALKIHAPMDGEGPESSRYRALLKTAADEKIPVVLHTGCIHSHVLYKEPALGNAERFLPWFQNYTELPFVLAHMNYHDPRIAMDLAEEYPHLSVDTSWQPSEIIGEAVRRLGAKKVLFGTDWPIVGDNHRVGIGRIQDCVESGTLSAEDAELVLGKNAECLLNSRN